MMNKKKLTAVVASVALVAVLGIGGTLMYFTDTDSKQNVITLGKVDGTLNEDSEDGNKTDTGIEYKDIQPGDKLNKVPTVTLDDESQDAYLRMKLEIEGLKDFEGYAEAIEAGLDIGGNWKQGSDGYYYYNLKLSAADDTSKVSQPLFTTVTIPTTWGNEVSMASFKINLVAELIQADNFEDGDGNIIRDPETNMIVGWNNTGEIEAAK